MFNKEEIGHILIGILILTFVVNFSQILSNSINYNFLGISFLFMSLIVLANVVVKKVAANFYEAKLETYLWKWQRFGLKKWQKTKKPIFAGIFFPFVITLASAGNFYWMAVFESNIEKTSARASKRHGIYRFTEMTENHMCYMLAWGVAANLLIGVLGYLFNLPQLGKWSIYYATFSLIPFGTLDGTKILFGNKVVWFVVTLTTLIFLSYALFLP